MILNKNIPAKFLFLLTLVVFSFVIILGYWLLPRLQNAPAIKNQQPMTYQESIPECYLGICPTYQSRDVDSDNTQSESVVIVPTRMTKGAGKVWVIKGGKVIFISPEYAGIGVKWLETNNGFIIVHKELLPLGELGPEIEQKYLFKNGTFELQP